MGLSHEQRGKNLSDFRWMLAAMLGAILCVSPKLGGFYPPKWMVKRMENPYEQRDDLEVTTPYLFLETPTWLSDHSLFWFGFWFSKVCGRQFGG